MEDLDNKLKHELLRTELETLYQVSQVLSHSLNLKETLTAVLRVLHDGVGMERGMVSLVEPETGELQVSVAHGLDRIFIEEIRYRPGEGVVGMILEEGEPIAVERIADEPRFLGKLALYDPECGFVGVPIRIGRKVAGVLAAQTATGAEGLLDEYIQFMEMVANLVGQAVRLSADVQKERQALTEERDTLRRTVRGQYGFDNIIGHTQSMRRVFEQVRLVAKWNTTVLIRGETGTGKELIAKELHNRSPRRNGPFITINCGAIPENLLESELFGHVRGAFTGATNTKPGKFQLADGGTLFLDEIGEMPLNLQVKLLRVLQEREVTKVGGTKPDIVDIRVVAATNKDIETAVANGEFREDLLYRINVVALHLPPLRARGDDIVLIATYLIEKYCKEFNVKSKGLSREVAIAMKKYAWPGNIRQLENRLKKAAILSDKAMISPEDLDLIPEVLNPILPLAAAKDEFQRRYINEVLELNNGNRTKTARDLGVDPRTIFRHLEKEADSIDEV